MDNEIEKLQEENEELREYNNAFNIENQNLREENAVIKAELERYNIEEEGCPLWKRACIRGKCEAYRELAHGNVCHALGGIIVRDEEENHHRDTVAQRRELMERKVKNLTTEDTEDTEDTEKGEEPESAPLSRIPIYKSGLSSVG